MAAARKGSVQARPTSPGHPTPSATAPDALRSCATASDKAFGALGGTLRTGDGTRAPLESLYLGGGTPSLLPEEALAGLIARVRDRFGLADGAEVTLECNPGADERGDARAAVQAGVTRFSIGVQSMNTAALRDLGRRHGPSDVVESVAAARAAPGGGLSARVRRGTEVRRIDLFFIFMDRLFREKNVFWIDFSRLI